MHFFGCKSLLVFTSHPPTTPVSLESFFLWLINFPFSNLFSVHSVSELILPIAMQGRFSLPFPKECNFSNYRYILAFLSDRSCSEIENHYNFGEMVDSLLTKFSDVPFLNGLKHIQKYVPFCLLCFRLLFQNPLLYLCGLIFVRLISILIGTKFIMIYRAS